MRARIVEGSLALSTLLALVAIALSLLGAAGWLLDVPSLTRGRPQWPAMQPNTALGLSLGAVAVLLLRGNRRALARRLAVCSLATIVLLLGSATLSEYLFDRNLGVDHLVVRGLPALDTPYPGRPSPQTALNFTLLGAVLLWLQLSRSPFPAAQIGALVMLANAIVALTGYLFGVGALYRFPVSAVLTGMSAPTALAFISLSIAVLCARPDKGMMTLVTSDSASAAIARRIVLILIAGWPLVGALTMLGANAGWYDLSLQASLFSLIMLGLLLWNTWRAAWHGDQIELSKRAADEAANKARDELDALAARVRTLFEQGSDGIFIADTTGRYTDVNSAGCRMLGYARDELVGKTILDLILPEDVPRFMRHREHLLSGGVEVGEWVLRRKDGTRLAVEVSAKILPDGQWQAFVRDITERKRVERALRLSEAKFSGIVSISADATILIDERQNIVMFNEGAEKTFGYSRAEAANMPLDALIPERFRAIHREHVERFAAGPDTSRPMDVRGRVFGLRKSGEEFPAEAAITKLTIEGERIFAVSLRDVTEQGRVESELRQAVKDREDTLAVVSHDLGNPLAAILMMAKQLRRTGSAEDGELNECASAIETSADQMMALIKDLLLFSKMQSGTFSVRQEAEPAKDVIEAAIEGVRSQAEGRRQTLTMDVPATLPDIACDRLRLVQALSNLLGNAVKFTPAGGAIDVRARRQGGEVVISVSDNGPGIPPEALPRIFDRYWQAEETEGAGAGLGLAIAKGIAEAHGGRIWAESQVGAGSTFHFAVPLDRSAGAQ